jgi:hypothetical protein
VDAAPAAAQAGASNDCNRSFLAAARLVPGGAAAAAALAAARAPVLDPSCPNCYPQLPMPDDGMLGSAAASEAQWRLAGAALWDQQQCVDVTAAVNSICLQVRGPVCMQWWTLRMHAGLAGSRAVPCADAVVHVHNALAALCGTTANVPSAASAFDCRFASCWHSQAGTTSFCQF